MRTLDGTRIIIPNKKIIGEIMHNYSEHKKLYIKIGVAYSSDVEKAIGLVKDVVKADRRVVLRPQPKIGISEFADSSVNIYARLWCRQAEYWDVMFDINKSVFEAFRKRSITIPFPQRDIHIVTKEKQT